MKKILVSALESSANLHLREVLAHLDGQICGIFDSAMMSKGLGIGAGGAKQSDGNSEIPGAGNSQILGDEISRIPEISSDKISEISQISSAKSAQNSLKFDAPLYESSEFNAMGFVEVLPLVFKAKRAMLDMTLLARDCDAVLLVDSPAFNLRLARMIKSARIATPVTYYILPQVWAWKRGRVRQVEAFCDQLASILPFDADFYTRAQYVGHPLIDELGGVRNAPQSGTLVFMPGSRKSEISRLMPIFREVARAIAAPRNLLVVPEHFANSQIYGDTSDFIITHDAPAALSMGEFGFICSGTATLQAALVGMPFVLCYKAKAIDIAIARAFVKVRHAGLANIICDFCGEPPMHEELIQEQVSAANLIEIYRTFDRVKFMQKCAKLHKYLAHGSAENVAKMIKG